MVNSNTLDNQKSKYINNCDNIIIGNRNHRYHN